MTASTALSTATRRALQPLFNAFDAVPRTAFARGVVLAVSGGPDSRALLEAFVRWPNKPADLDVVVVCVDHGQRPGAANEAAAVVARAAALGVVGEVQAVRVAHGDEATLRRARYGALHEVARRCGLDAVVTAHHKDDVVEGLMLHLLGLGGGRGGRAMAVVDERSDGPRRIRPLLGLHKSQLLQALQALAIDDVVVDEDDLAHKNARARVRHQVLPLLRQVRPDVDAALAAHAEDRRDDDDVLDGLVPEDDEVDAQLAPALLRRWLQRQIAARLPDGDPRTARAAIDDVLRLARRGAVGSVDVRGGCVVVSARGGARTVAVVARPRHSRGSTETGR